MILRPTTVLCIVAFSLNAHASDMAIVDAVTGNMQPATSTNLKPENVSNSGSKSSAQSISKFDYTAREKAREMKCMTNKSPAVEPLAMGTQTLVFACDDGRELKLICATGAGCRAP